MKIKYILNKAKAYISFNLGSARSRSYPTVFSIETTNICNLNCVMCPREQMTRPLGTMDFELYKKIIDEMKDYTDIVLLHEMGEPLIDHLIYDRIRYARKKGIKTEISTNATLLNEERADKLLDSGLDIITLCLDGVNKETYESVRRNGHFETTKANIENFLKLKNKTNSNIYTILQIIKMNETAQELNNFIDEWKKKGISEIRVKSFSTFADQVTTIKDHSKIEHRYIPKKIKERPPCYTLWSSVVILQDGTVTPCCIDFNGKIALGNVKEHTLKEIWNSKRFRQFRKMHINKQFNNSLCDSCMEWPQIYPSKGLINAKNIKALFKLLRSPRL